VKITNAPSATRSKVIWTGSLKPGNQGEGFSLV
jgi:hypothetical protein